jgi:ABC-type glycerol-3-phosphate transport system substrate-binding protein
VILLRNALLSIMLAAAAALLIFGPRPGAHYPPGRVVVTYWEKWTGNEGHQMQAVVDDFNRTVGREKGIYVQYLSMSSVHQKTLVATAAGIPPDIAGLWDGQVAQFAALDAVEPLDELAAERGLTRESYKPVYWRACTHEGRLYGLVSTPWAVALHYNKRIFRENAGALRAAGLDPDRPPRTLDELDHYAEVLDRFDPHNPRRLERAGYLPLEPGWFIAYGAYWFGGDIYDEKARRFLFTDPPNVRCFEWIRKYSLRLGQDAITEFRSGFGNFDSVQNPFLAGTVVMEQQGPWMANYIYNLKPSMSCVKWPKEEELRLPVAQRRENYEWAVAPFPSIFSGSIPFRSLSYRVATSFR